MEISVYNLIFNQMKSLSLFTEILESFDWDETNAKNFYEDVSSCLLSEEMTQQSSLPHAFIHLTETLYTKGYSELQIRICLLYTSPSPRD